MNAPGAPVRESAPAARGSGGEEGLDRELSDVVRTPTAGKRGIAAAGAALVLLLVFAVQAPSSESREATRERRARSARPPAPPIDSFPEPEAASPAGSAVAAAPAEAAPSPLAQELMLNVQRQALEQAEARRRLADERRRSPMVLYDQSARKARADAGGSSARGSRGGADEARLDLLAPRRMPEVSEPGREERFARSAALEPVETVRAERLEHPSTVVPQGTFIQGVLETQIQSDLPGMIRALVSAPVRAFDGTLVIPSGSRLIGRYQSGLVRGQTRVFVIWTRVLRPDGVSMRIDSPGTDVLGRAGVSGDVDTHFFEIFGSSVLLSLLDGGLDVAAANAQSGRSTVVQTGGGDLSRAAEIALQNRITVAPTIHVPRGTPIQVVVSKDLDFAGSDPRLD